ncbi:hypothetical protein CR513_41965, partial [Mucuna pruriens]
MSFGLKNSRATYQRLMDHIFKDDIGNQLEIYVDDMVVKRRTSQQFVICNWSVEKTPTEAKSEEVSWIHHPSKYQLQLVSHQESRELWLMGELKYPHQKCVSQAKP